MAKTIEVFYDVSSPWTYLAFVNVQTLAKEEGAEIVWRPFLVGGVFNTVNPTMYRMRENPVPARDAWTKQDMQAWAKLAGVKITFPPKVFPVNSVKALRGLLWAKQQGPGKEAALAQAFFELYWSEDRDISQDDVVAEAATRAGLDPARLAQAITEPGVKEQLKANTDELIARGGFGSPTLFVNGEMFFGNDRLPLVREALRAA
ncbi:MAG: 2-hydroxychromene-2-carboxylate isomerase [Ferrovibrio sp.]|uniref:2-hydroxychromene-2-carboxylate isomerase n=1 Tax=Ferrovibrio sp. TaxID=1917215 RepID=UPI0026062E4F|nr:2-hydroxychromene-2-carboxylate isomerase [Ferrovibrio sp.]MCW0236082.1 2-hydroxychromene-2-carboxylate isomerase [Ferrovibrio sp.]